jgi:23S rRNA (guanosine2251-2'-O)-methyltransferase
MVDRDLDAGERLFARADADPELGAELDSRLADDVTPLTVALAAWPQRPPEGDELMSVTTANVERLVAVVEDLGWPGVTRVGADGADAAWVIAQHGDLRTPDRTALLEALQTALAVGESDPRHYAMLADRVAAVDGRPQEYGTIVTNRDGVVHHALPVRDPDELEDRRRALGLPPVVDELPYLADGDLIPSGSDRSASPLLAWPIVLEGRISVAAALRGGVRAVHQVLAIDPADRRLRDIRGLAGERDIPFRGADEALVESLVAGHSHGGVIALVGPRTYAELDALIDGLESAPLVAALDGVEDPFTYGQAVRALYAAGADGLVVRQRSWETAAGVVTRASAGASELLPTAVTPSLETLAGAARGAGLQVACAGGGPQAVDLDEVDLTVPTLLVIGGERRGISRSFLAGADVVVRIPYGRRHAPSLGTAAAAAVIAFEARRQRRTSVRLPEG